MAKARWLTYSGFAVSAVALASCVSEPQPVASQRKAEPASVIDGYRSWTKANVTPHAVYGPSPELCISIPSHAGLLTEKPAHQDDFYVTVYVNEKGKRAMMAPKATVFPVGSIIVKEKLRHAGDSKPELLTVMVKKSLKAGADAWEYLAFDGGGKPISLTTDERAACLSCHRDNGSDDHTFRDYVEAVRAERAKGDGSRSRTLR